MVGLNSYWAESGSTGNESQSGHAKLYTIDGDNVTMNFVYAFTSGTWAYEVDVTQVTKGSLRINATGGDGTVIIHSSNGTGPLSGTVDLTNQTGIQFKRYFGNGQLVVNSFKMEKQ